MMNMATSSFIKIDGPLMSLELNKDKNKTAVAGRRGKKFTPSNTGCFCGHYAKFIVKHLVFSVFKIFSIDDGIFVEDIDLRGTDTVNLNYSFTDVTWNLKEGIRFINRSRSSPNYKEILY